MARSMVFALSAILSVSAVGALGAPAQGGPQEVGPRLDRVALQLAGGGYREFLPRRGGALDRMKSERLNLNLEAGRLYAVAVVCDAFCNDVDLEVFDETNNRLAAHMRRGDSAVVEFRPRWSGPVSVRVRLYDCQAPVCAYGLGAFMR
ncbi:hypothetical protein [Neomegalonema sp.]|uniref:hypothetical protein n=1 Tax=Neomegalonema sp. TaxID=2039713 RepID=UPI00260CC09A|nr:hypothetical protein [Neomegalonema sp.]MDD2868897.1 hypothetical protein [Neomegalonema sp.]